MADTLPVLTDKKFLGSITVDGTSTLTGNVTAAGTLAVTGNLTAPQVMQAITDPGDAGAIPVTDSGSCAITTAGGETRTLAVPTFAGQWLSLDLDVDAGNCVITVAAAVNQAGNTILTGADAGDNILLVGATLGGALVWRVVANDGWALS